MWDRRVRHGLRLGMATSLLFCLGITWGLGGFVFTCTHSFGPMGGSQSGLELGTATTSLSDLHPAICLACFLHAHLKALERPPIQPSPLAAGLGCAPPPEQPVRELATAPANARAPPSF